MTSLRWLRIVGPGVAIAATGVGAGDLLAAMLAGAGHAYALLWVIVVGAALKFVLNEGIARWQLATGTTFLEGWFRRLGRPVQVYFTVYLVVWGFLVAAGLMSACGVAAHALVPALPIPVAAILHALAALLLVWFGRYALFESTMKGLIAVMVVTLLASVTLLGPDLAAIARGLVVPSLPQGSAASVLGLMGGVGGSVTLLSYGYWIAEKQWRGTERLTDCRVDLAVGYALTGLFGVAMLVLAAVALGGNAQGLPGGSAGLVACGDAIGTAAATRFGEGFGHAARWIFLVGVWGAVFTSTLGVFQGVPYIFVDTWEAWRGRFASEIRTQSAGYRAALLYLALPPMLLLAMERPVWVIRLYTLASGLFMPLLAASLLGLNRARWVGPARNGIWTKGALLLALLLFAATLVRSVLDLG